MKKLIAITSALAMMLVLASCGGDTTDASSEAVSSTTPSTTPSVNISVPEPSAPPVVEESNNLALADNATWVDMNTGKTAEDEGYLAYYNGIHTLDLAFDGNLANGWQIASTEENLGKYVAEGEEPPADGSPYVTEIPEGAYLAEADGNVYKQQRYEDGQLWMGVTFSEAVSVDTIVCVWESGSMPLDDGYRYEYTTDGETWVTLEGEAVRGEVGALGANTLDETVTFEAIEVTGVRVVITKTATKYAPKVWEFELYAPEEAEEVESTDETVAE